MSYNKVRILGFQQIRVRINVIDFCAKFQLNWGSNECAMELKGTNKIENSSIEPLFYISSSPGSRHTTEVEKYRDLSTLNSSSRALGNVVMNFVEPGWMVHDGCVHLLITMRVFKP